MELGNLNQTHAVIKEEKMDSESSVTNHAIKLEDFEDEEPNIYYGDQSNVKIEGELLILDDDLNQTHAVIKEEKMDSESSVTNHAIKLEDFEDEEPSIYYGITMNSCSVCNQNLILGRCERCDSVIRSTGYIEGYLCHKCGLFNKNGGDCCDSCIRSMQYEHYLCSKCGLNGCEGKCLEQVNVCNRKGIKQYLCVICNKTFSRPYNYKRHIKYHNKEKPKCSKCNRSFNKQSYLKRHQTSCGKSKPECYCGKKFVKDFNLRRHMKKCKMGVPYECE